MLLKVSSFKGNYRETIGTFKESYREIIGNDRGTCRNWRCFHRGVGKEILLAMSWYPFFSEYQAGPCWNP